ncbi:hypothetical protein AVEN_36065-1, partial [Araneus ventricosus]
SSLKYLFGDMYTGHLVLNSKIGVKMGPLRRSPLLTSYGNFDALLQHDCERQNFKFSTKRCNYLHRIKNAKEVISVMSAEISF